MVERVVMVVRKDGTHEEVRAKAPMIDWDNVATSPYAAVISTFKFDKDTGELVHFERDDALQALAQLRDMHGFKAPSKIAPTDPTGQKPYEMASDADRVRALAALMARQQTETV
jgi:hypothetical protein